MRRVVLAVAAAMMCGQAEAAVFTETTNLNIYQSDGASNSTLVFVPNFDTSLGTLVSTTITLAGSATQTLTFYQNTPPTTGTFINTVQFNASPPVTIGSVQITPALVSGNMLRETFGVDASAIYSPAYTGSNPMLDLTFSIVGNLQTPACCANPLLGFGGVLTTAFTYTPVPEPISASLLLAPVLGLVAFRRRL